jgi:hypothetical protein
MVLSDLAADSTTMIFLGSDRSAIQMKPIAVHPENSDRFSTFCPALQMMKIRELFSTVSSHGRSFDIDSSDHILKH